MKSLVLRKSLILTSTVFLIKMSSASAMQTPHPVNVDGARYEGKAAAYKKQEAKKAEAKKNKAEERARLQKIMDSGSLSASETLAMQKRIDNLK